MTSSHKINHMTVDFDFDAPVPPKVDLPVFVTDRLLPIVDKVFDEKARGIGPVKIDTLVVDLGTINIREFHQTVESRLRQKLAAAVDEAILFQTSRFPSSHDGAGVGSPPPPATAKGEAGPVVSPLGFPPAKGAASLFAGADLYGELTARLFKGTPAKRDTIDILKALETEHPIYLLRLFRTLQTSPDLCTKVFSSLSSDMAERLVMAFLTGVSPSQGQERSGLIDAVSRFATKAGNKRAYYLVVLQKLVQNQTMDFQAILGESMEAPTPGSVTTPDSATVPAPGLAPAPAAHHVQPGSHRTSNTFSEKIMALLTERPQACQGFIETHMSRPGFIAYLTDSFAEPVLVRILSLVRPSDFPVLKQYADILVNAVPLCTGTTEDVEKRVWQALFTTVRETPPVVDEQAFITRFLERIVEQLPYHDPGNFYPELSRRLVLNIQSATRTVHLAVIKAISRMVAKKQADPAVNGAQSKPNMPDPGNLWHPDLAFRNFIEKNGSSLDAVSAGLDAPATGAATLFAGADLYGELTALLFKGTPAKRDAIGILKALETEHPIYLLRLFRTLQTSPDLCTKVFSALSSDMAERLVMAFLTGVSPSQGQERSGLIDAVSRFATKAGNKRAYYLDVLKKLVQNQTMDFQAILGESMEAPTPATVTTPGSATAPAPGLAPDPAAHHVQPGSHRTSNTLSEKIMALLTERPQACQGFIETHMSRPGFIAYLTESLAEPVLVRILSLVRPSDFPVLKQYADILVNAVPPGTGTTGNVEKRVWQALFMTVRKAPPVVDEQTFITRLLERIVEQLPYHDPGNFYPELSRRLVLNIQSATRTAHLAVIKAISRMAAKKQVDPAVNGAQSKPNMPDPGNLWHPDLAFRNFIEKNGSSLDTVSAGLDAPPASVPAPGAATLFAGADLYGELTTQLFKGTPAKRDAIGILKALETEHPIYLLRLFRTLQTSPDLCTKVFSALSSDMAERLVMAFLTGVSPSQGQERSGLIDAVSRFATKAGNKRAYYLVVLKKLVQNQTMDFQAILGESMEAPTPATITTPGSAAAPAPGLASDPAGHHVQPGSHRTSNTLSEKIMALLKERPQACQGFIETHMSRPGFIAYLTDSFAEPVLVRILSLVRPSDFPVLKQYADILVNAVPLNTGTTGDVEKRVWQALFMTVRETPPVVDEQAFITRFLERIVEQLPYHDPGNFYPELSRRLVLNIQSATRTDHLAVIKAISRMVAKKQADPAVNGAQSKPDTPDPGNLWHPDLAFRNFIEKNGSSLDAVSAGLDAPATGAATLFAGADLYGELTAQLFKGTPAKRDAIDILKALETEHPIYLLRLFRTLQTSPDLCPRMFSALSSDMAERLVMAFLTGVSPSKGQERSGLIDAVSRFATKAGNKRAYYLVVLKKLVQNQTMDFQAILGESMEAPTPATVTTPDSATAPASGLAPAPAAHHAQPGSHRTSNTLSEKIMALLTERPQACQGFIETHMSRPGFIAYLTDSFAEPVLVRILSLVRPSDFPVLKQYADILVNAVPLNTGTTRDGEKRVWQALLMTVRKAPPVVDEQTFITRFLERIVEQLPYHDPGNFYPELSRRLVLNIQSATRTAHLAVIKAISRMVAKKQVDTVVSKTQSVEDRPNPGNLWNPDLAFRNFVERNGSSLDAVSAGRDAPPASAPAPGAATLFAGADLYGELTARLFKGTPAKRDAIDILKALETEYPIYLLRLFRTLQTNPDLCTKVFRALSSDMAERLVMAFLTGVSPSKGQERSGLIDAVSRFATKAGNKRAYYLVVLKKLVANQTIDFQAILGQSMEAPAPAHGLTSAPAAHHVQPGSHPTSPNLSEKIMALLTERPQACQGFIETHMSRQGFIAYLTDSFAEPILVRILSLVRPSDFPVLKQYADILVNSVPPGTGTIGDGEKRVWQTLFMTVRETPPVVDEQAFITRFLERIVAQLPYHDPGKFYPELSRRLVLNIQSSTRTAHLTVIKAISRMVAKKQVDPAVSKTQSVEDRPASGNWKNHARAFSNFIEKNGDPLDTVPVEVEETIHIDNAGMVIASPYFPRLFASLGLMEGVGFKDKRSAERGVRLLHFMTDANTNAPFHLLLLNRILCNLTRPMNFLEKEITISAREQETVEGLIAGMIQNWPAIGNTSVQGFRESFLCRRGVLKRGRDNSWNLFVEPKPFDMLLDAIPWGFSTIKHPWMEDVVYVKWR
nr:contractile injection system tape measure protein [uncultured Desulfobacter sp.]